MNKLKQMNADQYKDRNYQNTRSLRNWTMAWTLSMAIAAFAPKYLWDFNIIISMAAIIISLVFGVGMLLSNRRYLRGLDEMQQRIMYDAMGLSLGVGLVVGLTYDLLEDIKLISFQPEIAHLVIIMCLTYLGGIIAGHRKFQ